MSWVKTNIRSQKLVEAAQEALYVGLRTVKPGIRLNEIGKAVQKIYRKPRL